MITRGGFQLKFQINPIIYSEADLIRSLEYSVAYEESPPDVFVRAGNWLFQIVTMNKDILFVKGCKTEHKEKYIIISPYKNSYWSENPVRPDLSRPQSEFLPISLPVLEPIGKLVRDTVAAFEEENM